MLSRVFRLKAVTSTAAVFRPLTLRSLSTAAATPSYTISDVSVEAPATKVKKWGQASLAKIKGHTKKLSPLTRQIAGLSANEAIAQMAFSPRARANSAVRKALESAVKNADFYHGLTQDQLMVDQAYTGKQWTSPRLRYHSKGRGGRSHYRTSRVSVKLREMSAEESAKLNRFKGFPTSESRAAIDPRGY